MSSAIIAGLPCMHTTKVDSCFICQSWDPAKGYIAASLTEAFDKVTKQPEPHPCQKGEKKRAIKRLHMVCDNRMGLIKKSESCGCSGVYSCAIHGQCIKFSVNGLDLKNCNDCEDYKPRNQSRPNPKAGVVIGTYGYPSLAELHVRLIEKHCPGTPILFVDDCSDGTARTPVDSTNFGRLCKLSRENKHVKVWSNPTRIGHAGGDLTSFFVGIQWANALGLDALVKLSFRFVFDRPNWIQEWLDDWWPSGIATSSRNCMERNCRFDIRSEAVMMDVAKWNNPAILDHLRPRPLSDTPGHWGVAAELVIWDSIKDRLDGSLHQTKLFGVQRLEKNPGTLWHLSNSVDDYRAVFEREGITMDSDFTTMGWSSQPNYKG